MCSFFAEFQYLILYWQSFMLCSNQKVFFYCSISKTTDFITYCQTFSASVQKAEIRSGWNFLISSTGEN